MRKSLSEKRNLIVEKERIEAIVYERVINKIPL